MNALDNVSNDILQKNISLSSKFLKDPRNCRLKFHEPEFKQLTSQGTIVKLNTQTFDKWISHTK